MMSSTSGMGVLFISAKETLFLCVRELRAVRTVVELIRKKIRKENVCWSRDCEFFVLCLLYYEHMHIVLKP